MLERVWLSFYSVNRASYDNFADLRECPCCYLLNPAYEQAALKNHEIIKLLDELPSPEKPKQTEKIIKNKLLRAVFTASNE
jgi:hypothetical protein